MFFGIFARKPAAPKPAAPILWVIPAHKGFTATVRLESGYAQSETFATLHEAQVWIMLRRDFAESWARDLLKRGISRSNAKRFYSIRNLETGKFAPYKWQLTRAEIN